MATRSNSPPKPHLGFGTRIRKSPFFESTLAWGCKEYTTYNHMYFPVYYNTPEEDFWSLVNDVTLWDVSVERQVEIKGPDASKFTQLLTPRNLSNCEVNQCKYVLNTNYEGGILSDPILLRLGEDHWWYSISDSDLLLWAMGVAGKDKYDIELREPDVSPLQIQGPKSRALMNDLFGSWINDLKYYRCKQTDLDGIPVVVSRTGWSGEIGYEVYLRDGKRGADLYEKIMAAGKQHKIAPTGPSQIRRVEAGIFSYFQDLRVTDNPFEIGMDRLVDLEMEADFVGKEALIRRKASPQKQLVGLELDGHEIGAHGDCVHTSGGRAQVGIITSGMRSPLLKKNIALCRMDVAHAELGTKVEVGKLDGHQKRIPAQVVKFPFYDPEKLKPRS